MANGQIRPVGKKKVLRPYTEAQKKAFMAEKNKVDENFRILQNTQATVARQYGISNLTELGLDDLNNNINLARTEKAEFDTFYEEVMNKKGTEVTVDFTAVDTIMAQFVNITREAKKNMLRDQEVQAEMNSYGDR